MAPGSPAHDPSGRYDPALIEMMACEIGIRPAGAPHFDDLAGALRSVRREGGTLVAEYDPAASEALAAVVAAERVCCASIGWHVERAEEPHGAVRLRMVAPADQLDALELLFRPGAGAQGLTDRPTS
jgi:hypothetical protein